MSSSPVNFCSPRKNVKVFGIGLSRTGTRSLTSALRVLGFDTVHYPTDHATLRTLVRGDARFLLLDDHDGITDITVAPYYEDLDHLWPDSKFVLTVRDQESWLRSCRFHWAKPMADKQGENEERQVYLEVQRFLRAAVYSSYEFDRDRFRRAYCRHVDSVTGYFAGRGNDLLMLDIAGGDGYEKLAPFLGMPVPEQPFPQKGNANRQRTTECHA